MKPAITEMALSSVKSAADDLRRITHLREDFADIITNYHRNSCYPEALCQETDAAVDKIFDVLLRRTRR